MRSTLPLVLLAPVAGAQTVQTITVTDAAAPIPGMSIVRDVPIASSSRAPSGPSTSATTLSELPGWPVSITMDVNFAPWRAGVIEDLDGDGRNEILVPGTTGRLHGYRLDGTPLPGFPVVLVGMAQYAPSVGDLDGDGTLEICQFTRGFTSGGRFYVLDRTGTPLPGFPKSVNNNNLEGSPTLADLDDDGALEILVPERAGSIGRLRVFEKNGSEWGGNWPVMLDHVPTGSPAVADLDHDGTLEIAYMSYVSLYVLRSDGTSLAGWPKQIADANFSYQSAAFANLDADAELELVVGAHQAGAGYYAYNLDGTLLPGWPKLVGTWTYVPPTVADLENDGTLEILGGREGTGVSPSAVLYAWNPLGALKPGFPYLSTNPGFAGGCGGSISVADIDGNGTREILCDANVMNGGQGYLYGVAANGTALPGFPLRPTGFTYQNGPIVTDANGDGSLDLFFLSGSGTSYQAHLYDLQSAWNPAHVPWGAYHQDIGRRGEEGGGRKLFTQGEFLLGATVNVHVTGTPGAIATVGLSTVNQHSHTAFGWYNLGAQRRIVNSVVIPASGEIVRAVTLPSSPILAGTRVLLQGAVLSAGTGRVTNLIGRVLH